VDTLRAVIIDVRWFLMLLLLITLFGFAGERAAALRIIVGKACAFAVGLFLSCAPCVFELKGCAPENVHRRLLYPVPG
jgi:hypothetical protein